MESDGLLYLMGFPVRSRVQKINIQLGRNKFKKDFFITYTPKAFGAKNYIQSRQTVYFPFAIHVSPFKKKNNKMCFKQKE